MRSRRFVNSTAFAADRRDKVDRAAQGVGAVALRIRALEHLDIAVGAGIDLEEVE